MNKVAQCPEPARWWVFLALVLALVGWDARAVTEGTVTNLAQLRALSAAEIIAGRKLVAEVHVAAKFRPRRLLLLTDGTNSISALAPGMQEFPEVGDYVRIEGVTVRPDNFELLAQDLRRLEPGSDLPPARSMPLRRVAASGGEWVEVTGHVVSVAASRGRAFLNLRQGGHYLTAGVLGLTVPEAQALRWATVRLTGAVSSFGPGVGEQKIGVWADSDAGLEVINPPARDLFNRPTLPLVDALAKSDGITHSIIHVNGVLRTVGEGEELVLNDGTAVLPIRPLRPRSVSAGEVVGVTGFLDRTNGVSYLNHAQTRVLGLPETAVSEVAWTNGLPDGFERFVPTVTRMSELYNGARLAASPGTPVRLRAGVSYVDADSGRLFLLDAGGGVQVSPGDRKLPPWLQAGQRLEVRGFLGIQDETPIVRMTSLSPNEVAAPPFSFPRAQAVPPLGFRLGRFQGRWVAQTGMVRRQEVRSGKLHLKIAKNDWSFRAVVDLQTNDVPPELVGAMVTLEGVADASREAGRLLAVIQLLVPSLEQVEVITPRDEEALDVAPISVGELLEVMTRSSAIKVRRIAGVVTWTRPGRFFLEDESGGIEVLPVDQEERLRFEERVVVTGFPVVVGAKLRIEDAVVEPHAGAFDVTPVSTAAHRVVLGGFHARTVSLEARLVGNSARGDGFTLLLTDGDVPFSAILDFDAMTPRIGALENGSQLRVTGVCETRPDPAGGVDSFRLLLRSEKDVRLVAAAPWWTPEHTLLTVGGLLFLVAGSVGWISFLRRRVEQTQGRFSVAFDANPLPVAIATRGDMRFVSVNGSFLNAFGFSRGDVIGRSVAQLGLAADEGGLQSLLEQLEQQGRLRGFDTEVRSRSGEVLRVLVSAEPIAVDGEECLLLLWQDVTERLNLMNQLRESQKMEAVGQLAAGVAHDFNNLLTIIRGNSELLRGMIAEDSEEAELNLEMDHAASRAAELTRQLLAFSRRQVLRQTTFDLNDVITGSMRMLQRVLGETIAVRLTPASTPVPVRADVGMLDQIIMNLAVNARDAMPGGGALTLGSELVTVREGEARMNPEGSPGEFAVLRVTDTGEGMDEATLKRVFEPFFTTKGVGQGTGLGLSTVYGVVRQHQGWINVDSRPGKGTSFACYLPAADSAEIVTGKEPDGATAFIRGTETILVVEDEPGVARMIRRTLGAEGYEVLPAANGVEARGIWRTRGQSIDLLLTDVVMPDGVNGLSLACELRSDNAELPVLFMSGYSDEVVRAEGEMPAGSAFIGKPFSRERLLSSVRAALDGRTEAGTSI